MAATHIHNAAIITLDEAGTVHHSADLVIEDGRIAHIGSAPPGLQADEVVDGSGRVAMPGFVNAHCHSPMTFERGWAEDLPFPRWLNEKIWVAESALTPDDVYWGAALAACEMIRSGTVAFNDHYFYMDRVAEVVEESGLKAALAWCVFGIGPEAEIGPGLEGTVEWIRATHGTAEGRIRTFLGPHSPYICPPEFLSRIVELAHKLGQGVHLHLSEDSQQVTASLARHGKRPVEYVDSLGLFDVPGGVVAAHGLALNEPDQEILSAKGVHVVHCPITYMKLAMIFPPLRPRLVAGVSVCLGTDGPGSNNDMDMFATMRQTVLNEKCLMLDPESLPGDQPLRMATQNGARALGFEGTGALTVGAPADLILVNLDAPHMRPLHSLVANLVQAAKGGDVTDVMVNGRWLMRNRELQTLDEARILYEAERHAQAMVRRGMTQVREYKA
ncbi:MAG TPA: amidohydrolase [Aggregatilineales bacterium]|nr:amidohydrolase [Aggregatilineales bacterium]